MTNNNPVKVDVFICGGGPVGLLLSYQLARLGLSVYTVEQHTVSRQTRYGRASTLYPRTMEMLDQLSLADSLTQVGLIGREHSSFRNGKKVHRRSWNLLIHVTDTFFDYALNIRQKYSEEIFRAAFEQHGGHVHAGAKLKDFHLDEDARDDYKVIADVAGEDGNPVQVYANVRTIANIPFIGERTKHNWVRIDAVVKTNMPDARIGFGAIESETHGNVLWVALDHGRTRIGFALSAELYKKYGAAIAEADVKREAVRAVAPFKLEFVMVDWWTLYSVGQRVAERFQDRERILLAGDAGHTHSSGAAQGMNTGTHDAVNLGWKLGGVLKGWYRPCVLSSYSSERRPVAQYLIEVDKAISSLISGKIPDTYVGDRHNGNVHMVLGDLIESTKQFSNGLGINYPIDDLLNRPTSSIASAHQGTVAPTIPVRLYQLTKNCAKFHVLVFAGSPAATSPHLHSLRAYLDSEDSFTKRLQDVFNFLTVIAGTGNQPDEVLGVEKFGYACYDVDHAAHRRYTIPREAGGIVVLRPDGIVGMVMPKKREVVGFGGGVEVGVQNTNGGVGVVHQFGEPVGDEAEEEKDEVVLLG
ncbi:hypothetical protein H2203_005653 [Taxawa tesnikishii (nom. ined.)]|nr:hypothetical protein H2203_005653 [Dothideales sp. JES 119]